MADFHSFVEKLKPPLVLALLIFEGFRDRGESVDKNVTDFSQASRQKSNAGGHFAIDKNMAVDGIFSTISA